MLITHASEKRPRGETSGRPGKVKHHVVRHVVEIVIGSTYAEDLKQRMAEKGISQNKLAEKLGMAASQVSRWFTPNADRRVSPSMESAYEIEKALIEIEREMKKSPKK